MGTPKPKNMQYRTVQLYKIPAPLVEVLEVWRKEFGYTATDAIHTGKKAGKGGLSKFITYILERLVREQIKNGGIKISDLPVKVQKYFLNHLRDHPNI